MAVNFRCEKVRGRFGGATGVRRPKMIALTSADVNIGACFPAAKGAPDPSGLTGQSWADLSSFRKTPFV